MTLGLQKYSNVTLSQTDSGLKKVCAGNHSKIIAGLVRLDFFKNTLTKAVTIFNEVYRYNSEWKFKAVGQGYAGGLRALAFHHGVAVQ